MNQPNERLRARFTDLLKQGDSSLTRESLCFYERNGKLIMGAEGNLPFPPLGSLPICIKALGKLATNLETVALYHAQGKDGYQLRVSFLDVSTGEVYAAKRKGETTTWVTPSIRDRRLLEL